MARSLKPIAEQTIVITGASSGIGLATARRAARAGSRVVLAARNEAALRTVVAGIRAEGGTAEYVVADVARKADVERVAADAVRRFGGFDTWVNNAGISIFGHIDRVSDDDHRRLFDVNFWGVVWGSQVAARHLRGRGGAIVNLGSVASDVAFPIQGMYAASKHAIKGFTDAFRMELMEEGAPISVTLVKPASIDTPLPQHARNYMDEEPSLPQPIYRPDDVAAAILHAAAHGGRDYYVGGGAKMFSAINKHLPGAVDWVGSRMGPLEKGGAIRRDRSGNLHGLVADGEERGEPSVLSRPSAYTAAQTHPLAAMALLAVGAAGLAYLAGPRRRPDGSGRRAPPHARVGRR